MAARQSGERSSFGGVACRTGRFVVRSGLINVYSELALTDAVDKVGGAAGLVAPAIARRSRGGSRLHPHQPGLRARHGCYGTPLALTLTQLRRLLGLAAARPD